MVGTISQEILKSLEEHSLTHYVNIVGYVSHKEAIIFQKKSQVLLLIEIDSEETKCIIPGKLFEYMVSNRPIIAIGPEDSDVEQIINGSFAHVRGSGLGTLGHDIAERHKQGAKTCKQQ